MPHDELDAKEEQILKERKDLSNLLKKINYLRLKRKIKMKKRLKEKNLNNSKNKRSAWTTFNSIKFPTFFTANPILTQNVRDGENSDEQLETKSNLLVINLLKLSHPAFKTPRCDDECLLTLKISHISCNMDIIMSLVNFIQSLPSLPSSVALVPQSILKGALVFNTFFNFN